MLHVTCDLCGKELHSKEEQHFRVKLEVFLVCDPAELTEADLEEDHMEVVGKMLREMEQSGEPPQLSPATQHLRFDLCAECRDRFLRDPLGKEPVQKFDFSEN